jgi:tetratricopeptide (TPR) repeat protein
MSDYFATEADSDDDNAGKATALSEEAIEVVRAQVLSLKTEGNDLFGSQDFEGAVAKYSEALNLLRSSSLGKDSVILLNRSASYIALQRYVPALNDANQAAGTGAWFCSVVSNTDSSLFAACFSLPCLCTASLNY